MTCLFTTTTTPRVVANQHADQCTNNQCPGCLPCVAAHCRVCSRAHVHGTCPECMAETREALHEIGRMCDALPEEVEHRGIAGEAMVLLGPAVDPEQLGHVKASIAAGRLSPDYLDEADHELHPLFVLGSWDMIYRDALEHDEAELVTIGTAVDYLDRQLTYAGGYEHVPFEDMARDLRRCAAHLEAVLHDGVQRDLGAPCMTCYRPLERVWGLDESGDGWKCHHCRATSSDAQYRFAVQHLAVTEAEWLSDKDMQKRTGVPSATVRSWARRGFVERKQDSGRTVYRVAQVIEKRDAA